MRRFGMRTRCLGPKAIRFSMKPPRFEAKPAAIRSGRHEGASRPIPELARDLIQGSHMQAVKITTDQPELNERFNRVLGETVEALEEAKINYAFIGGIASGGLGRPRSTHDIDVFVRPEDTEIALRALAKRGFRTEKTDPSWLYKAYKDNILVDIIFKSKGEIYLDNEMFQRTIKAEFHGRQLRLVAPEDLLVIKALAHSELTPGHWHDALALLSHATLDWDYLIHRGGRRAPRRLLSLLVYAHSNDIFVPKHVIDEFYRIVFGDTPKFRQGAQVGQAPSMGAAAPTRQRATLRGAHRPDSNSVAQLKQVIATDPRTHELDIQIELAEDKFLLRGEVMTEERRLAVEQVTREQFPDSLVENQIRVMDFSAPTEVEEVT